MFMPIATRVWEDVIEPVVVKLEYAFSSKCLESTQLLDFDETGLLGGTPNDRTQRASIMADVEQKLAQIPEDLRTFSPDIYATILGISSSQPVSVPENIPTPDEGEEVQVNVN